MKSIYLERYATETCYFPNYQPNDNLKLIVVIPCHDEPDLLGSLQSLYNCNVDFPVEVITVINASEKDDLTLKANNNKTLEDAERWASQNKNLPINFHFIVVNDLPAKHAGVGLARKIGMDEAVRMFDKIGNHNGVIMCYDADCLCTSNLLLEINSHFENNPKSPACAIHFEHPLEGKEAPEIYEAIINYELHLRYYIDALALAKFPYAFQTIGSSMAVRSSAYQKQGGMNRRKAGEDFYFLHKIIPLGDFTLLNSAMVIPSPRKSNRVPFGTGRAIGEWLESEENVYLTYAPESFIDLKIFFGKYRDWRDISESDHLKCRYLELPASIRDFMNLDEFLRKINEINRQSSNELIFQKRFFQWWDGFKVLKYVHFCRDNFYPNVELETAVDWLFEQEQISLDVQELSLNAKLLKLREFDKSKR